MNPTDLLHHVRSSEIAQDDAWIKELLSRKLMRNEYFKDAKPFVIDDYLQAYKKYVTLYRIGNDAENPNLQRSKAFEKAAEIQMYSGRRLFSLQDGARPYIRINAAGMKTHKNYNRTEKTDEATAFNPKITQDEIGRIQENYIRISPIHVNKMEAAELIYRAAMLLPRNDEKAAKLFHYAGRITKADPQIADKYYQALVNRCGNTKLGKACDEHRWFLKDISEF